MSWISRIASTLGMAPATTLPAAAQSLPDGPGIAHVRLVSINDMHGQLTDSAATIDGRNIGGAATLASYIQRERAANPDGTFVISAGDSVGASPPESTLLRHHPTLAVLGAMGVDLTTFGNHEFDKGYAEAMRLIYGDRSTAYAQARIAQGLAPLHRVRRRRRGTAAAVDAARGARHAAESRGKPAWPGSPFPWISANVVDARTKRPVLPPYVIRTINGVRVAFIAATTKDLKQVTLASGIPNLESLDPADAINRYIPQIRAQGVKAIVAVVHEGGDVDKADPTKVTGAITSIAERLDPEVDAVISAHTHKEYAVRIAGKQVIQASSYAKAYGVIDLAVDRATGDVVGSSSRVERNWEDGILPDASIARMVGRFAAAVAPKTTRVVTTISAPLTRVASPAGETSLGALIADAQRRGAKADIGLMNIGGVRQDIEHSGKVTWGDLFSVQPFGNIITRMELTGAEVLEVLEQQFDDSGGAKILQVSGITVEMDASRPVGQRIVKVTMADGRPLDPARTYSVSANSFIAEGGDGFVSLKKGRRRREIGDDLSLLVRYLEAGAPVPTAPPGRIKLIGGSLPDPV